MRVCLEQDHHAANFLITDVVKALQAPRRVDQGEFPQRVLAGYSDQILVGNDGREIEMLLEQGEHEDLLTAHPLPVGAEPAHAGIDDAFPGADPLMNAVAGKSLRGRPEGDRLARSMDRKRRVQRIPEVELLLDRHLDRDAHRGAFGRAPPQHHTVIAGEAELAERRNESLDTPARERPVHPVVQRGTPKVARNPGKRFGRGVGDDHVIGVRRPEIPIQNPDDRCHWPPATLRQHHVSLLFTPYSPYEEICRNWCTAAQSFGIAPHQCRRRVMGRASIDRTSRLASMTPRFI